MSKLFTPISIVLGLLAGLAARQIFAFIWSKFDDEDAPEPEVPRDELDEAADRARDRRRHRPAGARAGRPRQPAGVDAHDRRVAWRRAAGARVAPRPSGGQTAGHRPAPAHLGRASRPRRARARLGGRLAGVQPARRRLRRLVGSAARGAARVPVRALRRGGRRRAGRGAHRPAVVGRRGRRAARRHRRGAAASSEQYANEVKAT